MKFEEKRSLEGIFAYSDCQTNAKVHYSRTAFYTVVHILPSMNLLFILVPCASFFSQPVNWKKGTTFLQAAVMGSTGHCLIHILLFQEDQRRRKNAAIRLIDWKNCGIISGQKKGKLFSTPQHPCLAGSEKHLSRKGNLTVKSQSNCAWLGKAVCQRAYPLTFLRILYKSTLSSDLQIYSVFRRFCLYFHVFYSGHQFAC